MAVSHRLIHVIVGILVASVLSFEDISALPSEFQVRAAVHDPVLNLNDLGPGDDSFELGVAENPDPEGACSPPASNSFWSIDPGYVDHWCGETLLSASSPRGVDFHLFPGYDGGGVSKTLIAVVTGTYSYAPGLEADAECSQGDDGKWIPDRFMVTRTMGTAQNETVETIADRLDVIEAGGPMIRWEPVESMSPDKGRPECSDNHQYEVRIDGGYTNFVVDDANLNDNSGSLKVSVTRGPLRLPRTWRGINYQCPKYISEPFSAEPEGSAEIGDEMPRNVKALEEAGITLDSRHHTSELISAGFAQGLRAAGYPDHFGTGHDGIHTCYWPAPAARYLVLASGTYRYDQTTSASFGLADAECSTGYPPGDSDEKMFVPSRYRYKMEEFENKPGPLDGQLVRDSWNPYGTEWLPSRYEHYLSRHSPAIVDPFDLRIDNAERTWTPLFTTQTVGQCAGDEHHTYVLDPKPETPNVIDPLFLPQEPILFSLLDLVTYNEWDNCGFLQIRIVEFDKIWPGLEWKSEITVPEILRAAGAGQLILPTPPEASCNWVSAEERGDVVIKDRLSSSDPTDPFYYSPESSVVRRLQYDVAGEAGSRRQPLMMLWESASGAPHSITAAVDQNGQSCGPVNPVSGRDDCDEAGRVRIRDLYGKPLDSHPGCSAAFSELCMRFGERFDWTIPEELPQELSDDREGRNYWVIPYYCRFSPENMRGHLVVSKL